MSIQELSHKFKGSISNTEVLLALLIVVVACVSFYLGRMSVSEYTVLKPNIDQNALVIASNPVLLSATTTSTTTDQAESVVETGKYVASKSGTKYHLPWCAGAKQIKEENKIWFTSKDEAEKAGYTPAANCKGI